MVAVLIAIAVPYPAACDSTRAAAAFPEVPLDSKRPDSHRWAWATMAIGAGLIGSSFAISHRADRTYDEYLDATDPDRIEALYDRTVRYDRLSAAALIGGQSLVATGLYLRFLRRPAARLSLDLGPQRCAARLRF